MNNTRMLDDANGLVNLHMTHLLARTATTSLVMSSVFKANFSWLPVVGAIGAVLGACIAGAIGFASSWYTLRKQREITLETLEHQRARLFNERFATAADKLGHAQAATRLAGAYALAALADDWVPQQQTCIDVLCGYLRLPYQPKPGREGYREGEREVRLSIIRLIRDHLREEAESSWQHRNFSFHRVLFDGGNMSRIKIRGGHVSFYRAKFVSGRMDFCASELSGGTVNFRNAEISGGIIDLSSSKILGGSMTFPGTVLSGGRIDLRKVAFGGGTVDFTETVFSGGTVDLREPVESSVFPELPRPYPTGLILPEARSEP